MPNYFRIVAQNRNQALEKIERRLGHRDITILREGNLVNKKRKWFKIVEEKAYFIECVEYRARSLESSSSGLNTLKKDTLPKSVSLKAELGHTYPSSQSMVTPSFQKSVPLVNPVKTSPTPLITSKNNLQELVELINQKEGSIKKGGGNSVDCQTSGFVDVPLNSSSQKSNSQVNKLKFELDSINHREVYHFLVSRDFEPKFAKKISDYFDLNILHDSQSYHRLAEHIASFFNFSGIVKVKKDRPHYVFVVGSTGVGKTTTLSKIASSFYTDEEHCPKPSIIKFASLDAKRIMAMEQLRKFASILRVPFKSIYGVNDFKELCKNTKKKELILIDTSGVSKQDADLIDEISLFTRSLKSSKEIHLCVSSQGRYFDLKKTYEVLVKTKPSRIIITKIDESYSMGSVLSFIDEVGLPISYITNGQDVPIDIISASSEKVKKILLKEWGL